MNEQGAVQAAADDQRGSILIIGDWFIDEHWVVGVHRSPTSSRTGTRHRRALQPLGDEIRAFCGAGRSAFMLNHFFDTSGAKLFDHIIGMGYWHNDDTHALQHMFDPATHQHSPARITPVGPTSKPPSDVRLVNLHGFFKSRNPEQTFTSRIVRIYERDERGKVSYERIDWEPQLRDVNWQATQLNDLERELADIASECGPIRAVMVKDLRKKAVSGTLIHRLAEMLGSRTPNQPRWYVSSKEWKPSWLDELKNVNLELFMIPEIAAREAVAKEEKLSRWLTNGGCPTEECLDVLETLHDKLSSKGMILLSPGKFQVVARARDTTRSGGKEGFECVVQSVQDPRPVPVPMGGDSILFPTLAACIEYARKKNVAVSPSDSIQHSLVCTSDWLRAESNRVMNPPARWEPIARNWNKGMPRLLDISSLANPPESFGMISSRPWRELKSEWRQARSGLGVITIDRVRAIQLWRGMVEVPGYVALHPDKRKRAKNLFAEIKRFAGRAIHHEAGMLRASPGTGKTYFVSQLANASGLRFVAFNVTHVATPGEIVKWFDQIGSLQSANEQEQQLVFVDEINFDLLLGKVYGSFLSVLEDGTYVREGQTRRLRPCMWIFAGTDDPGNTLEPSQKGRDFRSRLNLGVIDLNDSPLPGVDELERIYLGVTTLRQEFPDVTAISEAALAAFAHFAPASIRDLKYFVRTFTGIQYGKVLASNVPSQWPGVPPAQHSTWKDKWPQDDPYGNQIAIT